jgi:hypothetical protein
MKCGGEACPGVVEFFKGSHYIKEIYVSCERGQVLPVNLAMNSES